MKKIMSIVLGAAMVAVMSTTAFAVSPIKTLEGTDSSDIKVQVSYEGTPATVYSVDVAWENTASFTYTVDESKGTWNPATHNYTPTAEEVGTWAGTATVKVTNHSNTAVNYSIKDQGVKDGLTVSVDNNTAPTLATAVGTDLNSAPTATHNITVSGTPKVALTKGENTIGTLIVTLTAKA